MSENSQQAINIQDVMDFIAQYKEISVHDIVSKFLPSINHIKLHQILDALVTSKFITKEIYIKLVK